MQTDFLAALTDRVLIADGAMGTMLQAADLSVDEDFQGLEGCNEILNVTRPEVVRGVHEAYLAAGADCVETNTFGANLGNLGDYDIEHRIRELSQAGAAIAREACDAHATADKPRYVLGSVGPGTKLPTLGHTKYATLRDAYHENVAGLVLGGADAIIVETCQDLLQQKAAIVGAHRAMAEVGRTVPIIAHVTVETTGTMLLGSEIGAALTALEPLGIDLIGLNCATGPAEMTEHLRYLAQHARVPLSVMPNAGLPVLTSDGAYYPLTAPELADALERFVGDYGLNLVGGCCGTTPEHIAAVAQRLAGAAPVPRTPRREPGTSSVYHHVPMRQDAGVLMVGERTNANGSKAFREPMLAGDWQACVEIARSQARDGSHLLDLCVDYVGRDGTQDMRELAGRFATASTLPIMLDSTEPQVVEAGLEMLGGRCIVNSVNYEDGDGPNSRYARVMPIIKEHGAAVVALTIDEQGQARDADWKVRVASRLIDDLTGTWGMELGDILVDCLTFPIATGQEETRRDGIETIEAIRRISELYPGVNFTLGISNISFGLNPAARQVLNSVFLHECVQAGMTSAIVHASKILPMSKIPEEQRQVALDMVYDRRREGYDPLQKFLELFEGVDVTSARATRAQELAALPLDERLKRRIIDGERNGLEADLDSALETRPALAIVNDILLDGMKVVGELFGSGQMQLPFVLQSAEVMKTAVAYLEPHMEKNEDESGKGKIVLATVKGDVHDIGKNLVDIILSNNGYDVVNIGIKQPINAIIEAAEQHRADAIGMSGLLVKSTVIMKENLQEMSDRGVADKYPVLLGGAALTRAYVEDDLRSMFAGDVHYARDAFEGLSLMDRVMAAKRGGASVVDPEREAALAARRARREAQRARVGDTLPDVTDSSVRSDVATDADVPAPPFFGTRVVKGIALAEYGALLDERATFLGQWGLRGARGGSGPSYEELVETEGRPRLRHWLDRLTADKVLEAAVVYGYFPAYSEGNDLVVLDENGHSERVRFSFPRQRQERRLCLADFFKPKDSGELDVVALQLVTVGQPISEYTAKMFARDEYRDYLEVHGLSVQLTEALAEYWHRRVRTELTLPSGATVADSDPRDLAGLLKTDYRGCRYALGYSACPDLEDRTKIVDLLGADRIGVVLSEEFQLEPEQSTDAIIVHHPEASYFNAK
ncbi:methionine synthase [Spirilliplanes yamanashiensis]|uniref:Methionine synthase n=1 Tax=Spirilliplanes yamanashiensis TaxID=42233 RepID=A0A8J4DKU8_9ACTN|nr:methionine synthase [Spirilliplanes yamanashiensis]MDP9817809.1 5-methyltetrahydrofolate--homocysteine methyltransferase [Spirilliplanes yamanashiensis]GIJ04619.1 5-methyltetrahydrofolate--homocysteine methyltransferase [Spirilliplanes yamanashiensis]